MQEAFQSVTSTLLRHEATDPEKRFLHLMTDDAEVTRTYGELATEARRYAGLYKRHGIASGDVVLLFLRTDARMFAAYFGAMLIGAVPSFMPCPSPKQHPDIYWGHHAKLFAHIRAKALLAAPATLDEMRQRLSGLETQSILLSIDDAGDPLPRAEIVDRGPDDLCLLQHSSGTTGLKKGVMLTHGAILRQVAALSRSLGDTPSDIVVSWLPLYHDMGLIGCTLHPLIRGQTITLLDPFEWASNPVTLFRAIEACHGTICWLPNFAFDHLTRVVREERDLSSMRLFNACSEPCKPATISRFAQRFAVPPEKIQISYAMAETVLAVTQTAPGKPVRRLDIDEKAARADRIVRPPRDGERTLSLVSNGTAIDIVNIYVEDERGSILPEGRIGELCVSGSCLFDGYYKRPDLTAAKLRDGVYHTGDLGFIDDGEVFVMGRKDDLIIVHGRNIYAHEIEAIVGGVDGIKAGRVVAFGIDNALVGSEEIVVLAEASQDSAELKRTVKNVVFQESGFTIREVGLVAPGSLVKTTSGKLSRHQNRERFLSAAISPSP